MSEQESMKKLNESETAERIGEPNKKRNRNSGLMMSDDPKVQEFLRYLGLKPETTFKATIQIRFNAPVMVKWQGSACKLEEREPGDLQNAFPEMLERLRKAESRVSELEAATAFHPRATKLMRKRKNFVVVAVDEPYFVDVYNTIRANEKEAERWTDEDEQRYAETLLDRR